MKIAWLHSHFLFWAGGTKFVYEVARRLHTEHPVTMIVERCAPSMHELYHRQGIEVIELNSLSSTNPFYWLFFPFYFRRDVMQLKKIAPRFDLFIASIFPMSLVAHSSEAHPYLTYILEPFAFFHDKDMIAGFPFFQRQLLRCLATLYRSWDVKGVQNSDLLMTINQGTEKWVKEIYGQEALLSYLGVDTAFFRPKFADFHRKYEGRKTIIHSTDFTPLKKSWDAIHAIERLKDEMPEVKLLITWSSENPPVLRRMRDYVHRHGLRDHVEFVGCLDHDLLPYYYSLADISLYTGIGRGASAASLFVLECMACETPGVRTDFTNDEIEHGVTGFLYRAGDQESLLRYLKQILKDDTLRQQFGKEARQKVLARYQWDAVAKRFLSAIESLQPPTSTSQNLLQENR